MPYATTSDVQGRVPYRTIDASTSPSATQVTAWITETDAILNGALHASDIFAEYEGASLSILKSWVVDRVTGLLRMAYASAGGDGANEDGKDLVEKFDKMLEDMAKRPAYYGAMLAQGDAPDAARRVRGYATDNDDDAEDVTANLAPIFTKAARETQF